VLFPALERSIDRQRERTERRSRVTKTEMARLHREISRICARARPGEPISRPLHSDFPTRRRRASQTRIIREKSVDRRNRSDRRRRRGRGGGAGGLFQLSFFEI